MAWLIVAGVVMLAIVVLGTAMMALMGHVRPMKRAVRRLRIRTEQAEKLQVKVAGVQERALALQSSVEEATARAERLKAVRTKERA